MSVRINQFTDIVQSNNNAALPIPRGYLTGETVASAGESAAMHEGVRFVEVAARVDIQIDGHGAGSVCWVFANTVAYFPAKSGQTFTWSALT